MVATALILLTDSFASPLVTISTAITISREIGISALREWMASMQCRDVVAVGWWGKVRRSVLGVRWHSRALFSVSHMTCVVLAYDSRLGQDGKPDGGGFGALAAASSCPRDDWWAPAADRPPPLPGLPGPICRVEYILGVWVYQGCLANFEWEGQEVTEENATVCIHAEVELEVEPDR